MLRILTRNIFSNTAGFAVNAVVTFFLTPFVLHSLGAVRYGIWALVVGVVGYYGLLDLGFRMGMVQYMTRYLAIQDFKRLNQTASTAFVGFVVGAAVVAAITLVVAWLAPTIFVIPDDAVDEARWGLIIVGCSAAIMFCYFPFGSVFHATQRFDISNGVAIVARLGTAAAILVALKLGYGLVAVCTIHSVGELSAYNVRRYLAYRILPELRVSPRLASWEDLRPIVSFSLWSFLIKSSTQVRSYASTLLIGILMPVAAIAPYSLALGLTLQLEALCLPIVNVVFPFATRLDARGELSNLKQVYLRGSRLLTLLALALALLGAVWADDFFRLWIGPSKELFGSDAAPALLFRILVVGTVLTVASGIGTAVLQGKRRVKRLSLLVAVEAITTVALTVWLIPRLGLVGAALGSVIPAAIFRVLLHPALACRVLELSGASILRKVFLRPVGVGLVLAGVFVATRSALGSATTWAELVLAGAAALPVALVLVIGFGLDGLERRRLLADPLDSIMDYLRRCLVRFRR